MRANGRRGGLAAALMALAALAALVAAGCGDDDGADVRASGTGASANASGSAGGSSSGTGLSEEDLEAAGGGGRAAVEAAVARYRERLGREVSLMREETRAFTDAVRAGDLEAARAAYAPSRVRWERIEPIAGLVEDVDVAVDARVDDFAGPDDPEFTGWHRLEHLLWARETTRGGAAFADRLDADLARLEREMATLEVPPVAMALGAAELIEEVSEGKITGEEDRYSKTDLWDFAANVEGARIVIDLLAPALREADPALLGRVRTGLGELEASLAPLRRGDGFVPFCLPDDPYPSDVCTGASVTAAQIDVLKAQLAGLSEDLALVPGALGLR
jgi:iron uptake system component EfeO